MRLQRIIACTTQSSLNLRQFMPKHLGSSADLLSVALGSVFPKHPKFILAYTLTLLRSNVPNLASRLHL